MKNMDPRYLPIQWAHWIETRQEFMARVGWCGPGLSDQETVDEYRAMLVAMKRDCTVPGMAWTLGTAYNTLMRDRQRLRIANARRGGKCFPLRMFAHKGKLMTCQQVADQEGCGYNTAYYRLTMGRWAA